MKNLLNCIFLLVFTQSLFSIEVLYEKPFLETYKLFETPVRQNVLKFFRSGIYISSECISKQKKSYVKRECKAWKPLEVIQSGEYVKYFQRRTVLPDFSRIRSVSIFVCIQSGGMITTEVNEYGRYSRDVEPMDFCQFSDMSLLSLYSIDRALLSAPKLSLDIFEKNTK
ncbi:MAG: hypothetical protein N3A69_08800 [Leptospiraceae bacterium]|nr:hypothetical protein [Leptospiraceae bacterium]